MSTVNTIHSGMKGGHFLAYTSCNTCHDPHGFSGGDPLQNSFLINLSTTNFGPNRNGDTNITLDQGAGGTCNFVFQGKSHRHVGPSYTK
ncbi:MAG: hypothetical protein OEW67_15100 [Cyclobacteriaceae bacterium]|nr:hypothetical protein [Cyclobacteriaceae bacterium]